MYVSVHICEYVPYILNRMILKVDIAYLWFLFFFYWRVQNTYDEERWSQQTV